MMTRKIYVLKDIEEAINTERDAIESLSVQAEESGWSHELTEELAFLIWSRLPQGESASDAIR